MLITVLREYTNLWMSFCLAATQFNELQQDLQKDESLWCFVDDKIRCVYVRKTLLFFEPMLTLMPRWNYDLRTRQFIIRMASTLHERFVDLVDKDISVVSYPL